MSFNKYNGGYSCKDCADRHPACHDTCEKYKETKKEIFEKSKWLSRKNQKYLRFDYVLYGDSETKNKCGVYAKKYR